MNKMKQNDTCMESTDNGAGKRNKKRRDIRLVWELHASGKVCAAVKGMVFKQFSLG